MIEPLVALRRAIDRALEALAPLGPVLAVWTAPVQVPERDLGCARRRSRHSPAANGAARPRASGGRRRGFQAIAPVQDAGERVGVPAGSALPALRPGVHPPGLRCGAALLFERLPASGTCETTPTAGRSEVGWGSLAELEPIAEWRRPFLMPSGEDPEVARALDVFAGEPWNA